MKSATPLTDASVAEFREGSLDFAWALIEVTRRLERDRAQLIEVLRAMIAHDNVTQKPFVEMDRARALLRRLRKKS